MKSILLLVSLFFACDSIAQQTINKLNVNELKLPKEASGKILSTDGSKNVKATGADISWVEDPANVIHTSGDEIMSGVKTLTGKLVTSSTTNGSVPCPSMSEAQRDLILTPSNGECILNTDKGTLNIYDSAKSKWSSAGGGLSPWITANTYSIDDIVVQDDKIYKAILAHTSTTFSADFIANKWVELANYSSVNGLRGTDINVPNHQATQIDSKNVKLETGNTNLLKDPSFEQPTLDATAWKTRTISGTMTCTASTAFAPNQMFGKRVLEINCTEASVGVFEVYQDVTTVDQEMVARAFISTDATAQLVTYRNGVIDEMIPVGSMNSVDEYLKKLTTSFLRGGSATTTIAIRVTKTGAILPSLTRVDEAFLGVKDWTIANIKNDTEWKSYGKIKITSTGTTPTKPTSTVTDNVECKQDGEDYICDYRYRQNSTTGASTGSGVYVFHLPEGIEYADSVIKSPIKTATGSTGVAYETDVFSARIGYANAGNNSESIVFGNNLPFATTGNTFQVSARSAASAGFIGAGFFDVLNANVGYRFSIRFKGKGLKSSSSALFQGNKYRDLKTHASFSANISSAGVVLNESVPFIQSCAPSGLVVTCTFKTATFSQTPVCNVNSSTTASESWFTLAPTTTTVAMNARNSAGSNVAASFFLTCHKTGQDAIDAYRSMAAMAIDAKNITGLARYIVKTYSSGDAWYEVNNDGWVRQGNTSYVGGGASTLYVTNIVKLQTKATTANFIGNGTATVASGEANVMFNKASSSSTQTALFNNVNSVAFSVSWVAEGYGDSATVTALGATPSY